jgi:hypothetical protein
MGVGDHIVVVDESSMEIREFGGGRESDDVSNMGIVVITDLENFFLWDYNRENKGWDKMNG